MDHTLKSKAQKGKVNFLFKKKKNECKRKKRVVIYKLKTTPEI